MTFSPVPTFFYSGGNKQQTTWKPPSRRVKVRGWRWWTLRINFGIQGLDSRNGVITRMGNVVCLNDTERWTWDFWSENPPETPQVTYKGAYVDSKLQLPLEDTTSVPIKCRRTWARSVQSARTGTSCLRARRSQLVGPPPSSTLSCHYDWLLWRVRKHDLSGYLTVFVNLHSVMNIPFHNFSFNPPKDWDYDS